MQLSSVNFTGLFKKTGNKCINKTDSNTTNPWDNFEADSFELQEDKKKPKRAIFKNPVKEARKKAEQIIQQARQEAVNIRAQAEAEVATYKQEERRKLLNSTYTNLIEEIKKAIAWKKETIAAKEQFLEQQHKAYTDTLIRDKKSLEDKIVAMRAELKKLSETIDKTNSGFIEEEIAQRKAQIEEELNNYVFDYDYYSPKSTAKKMTTADENFDIVFDEHKFDIPVKKSEKSLPIPEFVEGKNWNLKIPQSTQIKLPQYGKLDFREVIERETSISMSYADAIPWSADKIARDLLQNFFDGHGQTLDGVNLSFELQENGKYKVRIEGDAFYSQEKAILLGESSKRNNSKAAGNFGEGLKVVVLKLLKDCNATKVDIASDDWKVEYKAKDSEYCNKEVLAYSLIKQEPINGNYIEFETDNTEVLKAIVNSISRFNHSANPDFQNLDFENELFGIKILDKNQKGSVYIAGQEFEFANDDEKVGRWKNLSGLTLILKNKPKATDESAISRDRLRLTNTDLHKYIHDLVLSDETSEDDICKLLNIFKDSWKIDRDRHVNTSNQADVQRDFILDAIISGIWKKDLKIEFPKNYLATDDDYNEGNDIFYPSHVICSSDFGYIGMKTVAEKMAEDKLNGLIEPNEFQVKKIALIKKVLQCLKPSILSASSNFYSNDLNPNIYIAANNGTFAGEHCEGGFWITEDELNSSFDRVISTALHEISHKVGGDGTMQFTYALTEMLHSVINATLKDQNTLVELRALKSCWDELTQQENKNALQLNNNID